MNIFNYLNINLRIRNEINSYSDNNTLAQIAYVSGGSNYRFIAL
ncbi:MAG: hypothetical protein ACI955_000266 [Zhongshania sp.]|jgi:hypothetical protein